MKKTLSYVLSHGRGVERIFLCPVHNDHNPSASVNVLKRVWCCYTCGARGALDDSVPQDHADIEDVLEELADLWEEEDRGLYPESWLQLFTSGPMHPYWLDRFTAAACSHFQLGYDPTHDVCTYPLRNPTQGLLGVVQRRIHGETPKYRYPLGSKVSELLFNYGPAHNTPLVLVEGAMDVVAAWEAGFPTCCAVYGSTLSHEQIRLIHSMEPSYVAVCFDADTAGRDAGWKATDKLQAAGIDASQIFIDSRLGKDLGELTIKERQQLLATL